MSTDHITLFSSGLLSKWGFSDGEPPEEWLDYLDARGIDPGDADWPLIALVRRYLLPALAAHHDIEVYELDTIHNPIRARVVDGAEIDDRADNGVTLTPAAVSIPMDEVARIALQEEVGREH